MSLLEIFVRDEVSETFPGQMEEGPVGHCKDFEFCSDCDESLEDCVQEVGMLCFTN